MPRGLGDDPLSRGKKGKRAAQNSVQESPAQPDPSIANGVDSYNDVFFQRRAEVSAAVEVPVTVTAEPEATVAVPSPAVSDVVVPETPAPLAGTLPSAPQPEPQAFPEPTSPPLPTTTQEAQPQPPKAGFLSRIFGKLRK